MPSRNGASSFHPATSEPRDTIAALATAPGRGAIAIVRASGPQALTLARRLFRPVAPRGDLQPRLATFGAIVGTDGTQLDEGLALYFAAPHSATGEDVLELHVHGSPAVARDVLIAMFAAGARRAEPGEFTRRAFESGKIDLPQAEAVADLIASEYAAAARAAAARLSGGLAQRVDELRAALEDALEELSASLDFPDEVEAPSAERLRACIDGVRAGIGALSATYERGRLIREGAAVAIVGPPNAGKSSLLNGLLENDRALVSEIPGTTRDTIEEAIGIGGIAVRLIDTAGIRARAGRLEAAGIARTERALADARLALVVVDGSAPLGENAQALLARTRARERVVFFNKSDLGRSGYDRRAEPERAALFGSVRDPASLDAVRAALEAALATNEMIDLARPHLGTARQAAALLAADRALAAAQATLDAEAPVDLVSGDLMLAVRALGELTGREADERLLDAVFARFCIGK